MGFFAKLSRYVDDFLLLPDEAREMAEKARSYLDAGDYPAALKEATSALSIRSDHPQLLFLSGEALRVLGESGEAEKMFQEALEIDSDHSPSLLGLGQIFREAGKPEKAAKYLRKGASLLVGSGETSFAVQAFLELAQCHLSLHRPDRAARELRKAVSLSPDDPSLHTLLARALLDRSTPRKDEAQAVVRRSYELLSDSTDGKFQTQVGLVALEPWRWIVERTFGWMNRNRRLSKDYERLSSTSEAWFYIGMIRLMLRRIEASQ